MKAALQFIGGLSHSLNVMCRGSTRITMGSLQDEARAISSFVQSPRCFSSDWSISDWPERRTAFPTSKGKGDLRDKRQAKQGKEKPSRVKRENELKRMAKELRKSRRGYDLPGRQSNPRNSLEDMGLSDSERFKEEAQERILVKGEAPHWHSWSPCTRKCNQGVEENAPDSEKPLK